MTIDAGGNMNTTVDVGNLIIRTGASTSVPLAIYQAALSVGQSTNFQVGVSGAAKKCAELRYIETGTLATNYLSLGLESGNLMTIDAGGNTTTTIDNACTILRTGTTSSFPLVMYQATLGNTNSNTILLGKSATTHNTASITFYKAAVDADNLLQIGLFNDPQVSINAVGDVYARRGVFTSIAQVGLVLSADFNVLDSTISFPMSAMVSDSTVTTTYGNEIFNYSGLNFFTNVSGRALQVLVRYSLLWDANPGLGLKTGWFSNGSAIYVLSESSVNLGPPTTAQQVLTLPAGDSLILNLFQHYTPFPFDLTVRVSQAVPGGALAKTNVSITVLN